MPMVDGVWQGGRLTAEQQAELRRLWAESGWSQEAIAAHFGFSRGVLMRWRHRLGLPTRGHYPLKSAEDNATSNAQ